MVEVVAALIWDKDKFMICQRPANKARALLWEFVGALDVVDRIALDETVTDFAKRLRLADKED